MHTLTLRLIYNLMYNRHVCRRQLLVFIHLSTLHKPAYKNPVKCVNPVKTRVLYSTGEEIWKKGNKTGSKYRHWANVWSYSRPESGDRAYCPSSYWVNGQMVPAVCTGLESCVTWFFRGGVLKLVILGREVKDNLANQLRAWKNLRGLGTELWNLHPIWGDLVLSPPHICISHNSWYLPLIRPSRPSD